MAEPTPEIKAELKESTKKFWEGTPVTLIAKAAYEGTSKKTGSTVGKIISSTIVAAAESEDVKTMLDASMPQEKDYLKRFLIKMGLPPEDADGFLIYLTDIDLGSPIINWLIKAIVGLGTSLKFTNAIWQVADQAIGRTINRKASLLPGDFDSLYRERLLNRGTGRYEKLIGDLGLNPTWQAAMENARHAIVNPQEIAELFRRGLWGKEDALTYLRMNQYEKRDQQDLILQLAMQLTPATTLLEMNKRGEIKEAEAIDGLKKFGFEPETVAMLIKESKPLFGTSEIVPLTLKGYMDSREATDRLKKLGYNDKDIEHINKLALKPLSEDVLFQSRWRGFINDVDFNTGLKKLGYNAKDAQRMRDILWQPAPPSDTIRFAVREVYSPDIATKFGLFEDFPSQFAQEASKVGIAEETAKQYWAAHWQLPAPGQGFDMYHRGLITYDELKMLLKALDVMPFWRDKMIALNDSLITRRQLRQLLKENIETPAQVKTRYIKLGFSNADANTLVRLDLATLEREFKDLTKAELMNGFVVRLIDEQALRQGLIDLNYSAAAQDFYIADAKRKRFIEDAKKEADSNQGQADESKAALTNDIIAEYQSGMISREDAMQMLLALEYWESTADMMLANADLQQIKKDLQYYATQIKRMFDVDAIDSSESNRLLATKGYDVTAAAKLVGKWDFEKYADAKVNEVKVTNPTKAEFKKWVKNGIATVEEYVTYLQNLRYDVPTIINYVTELMLDVETETP